ncbi:MAG: hypothetical protein KBT06_08450 [Prevotellaceae bacterium]|nr:hypothetical protein [Candidatus Colivivens equi]
MKSEKLSLLYYLKSILEKKTLPDGFAFDSETAVSIIDQIIEDTKLDKVFPNVFNTLGSKDDSIDQENGIDRFLDLLNLSPNEEWDDEMVKLFTKFKKSGLYHYLHCLGVIDEDCEYYLCSLQHFGFSEDEKKDYRSLCEIVERLFSETKSNTVWFYHRFIEEFSKFINSIAEKSKIKTQSQETLPHPFSQVSFDQNPFHNPFTNSSGEKLY